MKIDNLQKYSSFYTSSQEMGSAKILRQYLGLEDDFPIPLSISHGVDFNHFTEVFDALLLEPIHWAYNKTIYERVKSLKPAVMIPHPWLLISRMRGDSESILGKGTLVVSGYPGRTNDLNLHRLLSENGLQDSTILLKKKGGSLSASEDFWVTNGFNVESAGERDENFYLRLYDIISRYEYIVGCTCSSALVFSAALGKKVSVIQDYCHKFYDQNFGELLRTLDWSLMRDLINLLIDCKYAEYVLLCRQILGSDLDFDPQKIKKDLLECIESLQFPFQLPPSESMLLRKIRCKMAKLTKKTHFIMETPKTLLQILLRKMVLGKMGITEINEIDACLNGVNSNNLKVTEVSYVRGITTPGRMVVE